MRAKSACVSGSVHAGVTYMLQRLRELEKSLTLSQTSCFSFSSLSSECLGPTSGEALRPISAGPPLVHGS
ncbi:hypothetical protein SRHO_G00259720 [Serrasalmus rhombeus]